MRQRGLHGARPGAPAGLHRGATSCDGWQGVFGKCRHPSASRPRQRARAEHIVRQRGRESCTPVSPRRLPFPPVASRLRSPSYLSRHTATARLKTEGEKEEDQKERQIPAGIRPVYVCGHGEQFLFRSLPRCPRSELKSIGSVLMRRGRAKTQHLHRPRAPFHEAARPWR